MSDKIIELGNIISQSKDYTKFDINDIISVLKLADDLYHNGDQSFLTDQQYDSLRLFAEQSVPHHVYFTGVGADVRGGKIKLPYKMGSLDQVYEGEIENWIRKWDLYDNDIIISDKLDGTSALLIYDEKGKLQIAYSRGNGIEGADITRHIKKIKNVPKEIAFNKGLVIRAEVILQPEDFQKLRTEVKSRSNEQYKNPRNMVAGLMNAKENPSVVYDYLHVVCYEILNIGGSKHEQLEFLRIEDFNTVPYAMYKGKDLSDDTLTQHLTKRRQKSFYEIDGVVIDVDNSSKRSEMNPTKETLNPAYSVKYKVADASNLAETEVTGVQWNVSKHGYLKPTIQIKPVELVGVTVSNATAFNAKFVHDNKIGPGARIKITRSGDTIPFILEVVKQAPNPQMPEGDWEWNETGVDVILGDHESNHNVIVNRLIDFFSTIEAPHLKEGNIKLLVENGLDSPEKIINASETQICNAISSDLNGAKIYNGLHKKLTDIPLYKLIGAHSKERGIGVRKIKKIQQYYGKDKLLDIIYHNNSESMIKMYLLPIEGFEEKTIAATIKVLHSFEPFFDQIKHFVTLLDDSSNSNGVLQNEKVVFTGFRDKQLQSQVEQAGGSVMSSVSGKTTIVVASDPNSSSSKLEKARNNGAKIVSIEQLKDMLK